MNNTSMRSDEVDGAFPIHHNVRQKVPDTRRGDDGVQFSTPRSRNEIDGAFLIHHNVRQKVPDTRKTEDGV